MLTLYGQKQPNGDVLIFEDKERRTLKTKYPAHYSNKPTRRNKYVMCNSYKYRLEFIPDAKNDQTTT